MIRVTRSENQLGSESDDEPELQVLDSGRHKAALSPHLGKQRKRRLKFFVVFHGDRASRRLPHSVRIKCPRDMKQHGSRQSVARASRDRAKGN